MFEPSTLAEMEQLETHEFKEIDRYHYRGDLSASFVIDHIIDLAARELEWQGRQDANSLRDFWYNPVKPILETAVPNWGDGAGTSDWNRGLSKRLSGRLSKKVKDQELTYRDLNILDDSRDRRIATESLENDKILFVEKSAAYRKLKPLAEVYDITLVEGSGWQATALIEDLSQQLDPDQEYVFWVLGDYDPTGFGIVEDFVDRAANLGIDVDADASRRIGVWPEQVDDEIVEQQKFTVGGSNNEDWKRQYGIDGEYGLEIEAVGESLQGKAEALRELVKGEIEDAIDADQRRYRDTQKSAAGVPGSAARRVVDDITEDLTAALAEAAAEIYADVDGVLKAEHKHDGFCSVSLDRDRLLNGGIDDDLVPQPYTAQRLHSAAVSGNEPYPNGTRTAKKKMQNRLLEQIEDGEIDVAELLNT